MSAAQLHEALAGVPLTAIGVALIRAKETARPDRLYEDRYAQAFADAARARFHDPAAAPEAAATWARMEALVDPFYEARSLGVRLGDDRARDCVIAGCTQIVVLGAGLDTRAFRLGLPADVHWFEIDLPPMFAFKEPLLDRLGGRPTCHRHVVPANLCGDWVTALTEAGFRPSAPTAWLEEGVLGYLSRDDAIGVATAITRLSAPGSHFGGSRFEVDQNEPRYQRLRALVSAEGANQTPTPPLRGLGPDPEPWLNEHGWHTEFHPWDELIAPFNRPAAANGNPRHGVITAIRE